MARTGRALEVYYNQNARGEPWGPGRKLAPGVKVEMRDRRRLNWASPRVFEPERQSRPASPVHVRYRREGDGAIVTDFSVSVPSSWVAQFGRCILRPLNGTLGLRGVSAVSAGSTETRKAVADAVHGIAEQAVFRGITAAATSKGARAGPPSVNIVDCPGGVQRGPCRSGAKDDQEVGVGRLRSTRRRRDRTLAGAAHSRPRREARLDVLDDTKSNANRVLRKTAAGSPARRTGRAPEFLHEALMQRDPFACPISSPSSSTIRSAP
jgi:hypothetical protein